MKDLLYLVVQLFNISLCLLLCITSSHAQKKNFSYEQVFEGKGELLSQSLPQIEAWMDDQSYLMTESNEGTVRWVRVQAASGESEVYTPFQKVNTLLPQSVNNRKPFAYHEDFERFLVRDKGNIYCVIPSEEQVIELPNTEEVKNPRFSPDGNLIAFTRNKNLCVVDIRTKNEYRLTNDSTDLIYNGWASWVYMEEILGRRSNYAAFWWSPNSEMLAFLRFDDRPVPEFPIYVADGVHGYLEAQRYPKSGDPSPIVKLGIAHINSGEITWVDINENFEYTAWPFWTPDSKELWFQQMNRDQDHIEIFSAHPETGDKKHIYTEKQESWVEFFKDITFLPNNQGVILRSDKDGWRHLYHYDMDGKLVKQLTQGNWDVNSIEGINQKGEQLYFMGNRGATTDNYLFRINLDGTELTQLTPEPGTHSCEVSPSGNYIIDTYSSINQPGTTVLRDVNGDILKTLGSTYHENVNNYRLGKVEMFTIPSTDGFELPAIWTLPPDFDETRKYPVIYQIYSGPGSARVRNRYASYTNHYWAQQDIIVITVDHRGSGHFGKAGKALMHRNLGKWEMHDLIESVKWLRQKPFIDETKIGITGGSYGGYTTCMALTYGSEYFTHGVARASVTDWHLYDNVYTERYMDHPEDNPEGYENGSVMTYADRLTGKLLITHGSSDDNVHMQNTMQLVDKLIDEGKQFDFMIYPNQRHGFRGTKRTHSNRLAAQFWFEHFVDKPLENIELQVEERK